MGTARSHNLINDSYLAYTAEFFEAREIHRPFPYSLDEFQHQYVRAKIGDQGAEGWGSGVGVIATEKAKSEALERLIFRISAGNTISTSNGWAAHTDLNRARTAAVSELIEREVALRTWFDGGTYSVVPKELWPVPLLKWNDANASQAEFNEKFQKVVDCG